jgi:hypothetical protein
MKVKFHEYVGLAGDLQALLIAKTDDGREETVLFNRTSFYKLNRRMAEKKLLRRLKR